MSNSNHTRPDFSRYFSLKQRAFLINISEGRDRDQYESLGGVIVSCSRDTVAFQIPYNLGSLPEQSAGTTTYKLTSEYMGQGFQIMAELIEIAPNNILQLRLKGGLEMFQRRQTVRIDTTLDIFQIRRDTSLAIYRKEFKRIMDGMKTHGARPKINLQSSPVNLSAGGIRISIDAQDTASPLTMLFLDLDPSQPLVCAVAETVWVRREKDRQVCGYRFVQINKADQERISRYVQSLQKDQVGTTPAARVNWVLVDRMITEEPAGKT